MIYKLIRSFFAGVLGATFRGPCEPLRNKRRFASFILNINKKYRYYNYVFWLYSPYSIFFSFWKNIENWMHTWRFGYTHHIQFFHNFEYMSTKLNAPFFQCFGPDPIQFFFFWKSHFYIWKGVLRYLKMKKRTFYHSLHISKDIKEYLNLSILIIHHYNISQYPTDIEK